MIRWALPDLFWAFVASVLKPTASNTGGWKTSTVRRLRGFVGRAFVAGASVPKHAGFLRRIVRTIPGRDIVRCTRHQMCFVRRQKHRDRRDIPWL